MKSVIETFEATSPHVKCEGGLEPAGHPRVYLEIDPAKGKIDCPYCGKLFILKNNKKAKK